MTFYDFTITAAAHGRVFSVMNSNGVLACVRAVDAHGKETKPRRKFDEYADHSVSGEFILAALRPLIGDDMVVVIPGVTSTDTPSLGDALALLDASRNYTLSWGGI